MIGKELKHVVPVALVGYGLGGATFHAPVIAAVERLRIATVVTSRKDDVARNLPGIPVLASADDAFADPAIELVVIATPNDTHFELARRALAAGKHVVIDKPITISSAQADELIALAAERGRLLSVYQNRRWDGDFRTVAAFVASGRLGRLSLFEVHFDRFRPAIKPGWREVRATGSGVLFDLGSHLIDQVLTLFGMPQTVFADRQTQRPQALVDDYLHLILGYREHRAIVHVSTLVREPGPHFVLHGDGGSFVKYGMDPQEAALKAGAIAAGPGWGADDPANFATFVPAGGPAERIPTLPGAYADFYRAIAAAILDGGPVPVTPQQARDVVAVIELAQASASDGRVMPSGA